MNLPFREQNKLSPDLTFILLRGNGSPRAFRIKVPALFGYLFSLSGALILLASGCVVLTTILLWNYPSALTTKRDSVSEQTASPPPTSAHTETTSQAMDAIPAPDSVIREEFIKRQAEWENRKRLGANEPTNVGAPPLQLLSPNSTTMAATDVFIKIGNIRPQKNGPGANLQFDITNTHPNQQQVRGYIVVLAKSAKGIFAYPEGVLSPGENFLVNYARGETFAVSRFRQAFAQFASLPEGQIFFQILLFATDGKILLSTHLENK